MPEDKKNKLFLVITKGNFGGAQRYVYDLATNLPSDKYDLKLILGEGMILEEKLRNFRFPIIKIKSLKRDIGLFSDLITFFSLFKTFSREKPAIIHLNSSKAAGLGVLAGRLARVQKIIFTGHGWAFNEQRRWSSRTIIIILYWLIVLLSHQTIAVSEKTKKDISWLPLIGKKISVIHNGAGPFTPADKLSARRYLAGRLPAGEIIPDNALWLGSMAELHPNKGLETAIRTIRQLKLNRPVIYLIIGEGEDRPRLEKLIADLGLTQKVFLIGFVSEARRYLTAFDIFLFPSQTEALPYALLEAGQIGLAVIASKVGGIPEIITDRQSGLLIPTNNSQLLTSALTVLATNENLRLKLGRQLREKVSRDFSLTTMIEKTLAIYNMVPLGKPRG